VTNQTVIIGDAIANFVAGRLALGATEQAELRRFERWLGKTKTLADLKPLDIEHYAEKLSPSDTDYSRKIDVVRSFLAYARDKGWTAVNLGVHIRTRKDKSRTGGAVRTTPSDLAVLTKQGYDDSVKELAELNARRPRVLEDIRRAAADKDFRENAPLHAAREQLGYIDGRIQELTAIIKSASIIGEGGVGGEQMALGDTVRLMDTISRQVLEYTIVGPKEADPARGKISHISPIGKAVIGKMRGDVVDVTTPSGNHSYRIDSVKKG